MIVLHDIVAAPCVGQDFKCANGQECTKNYLVCDGIRHCGDASDEIMQGCKYGKNIQRIGWLHLCILGYIDNENMQEKAPDQSKCSLFLI